MSPHRTLKTNILRNLRDQPLHTLWGFASTFGPFVVPLWVGSLYWLFLAIPLSLASIAWIVIREWKQWPPHDWWDAPLDWTMYVLGGLGGLVLGFMLYNADACACVN